MAHETTPIKVAPGSELARLLDAAARSPVVLEKDGVLYQVNRVVAEPGSLWLQELYALFAPWRAIAEERGYTEEEINADIDAAIEEVRAAREPHG